MGNRKVFEDVPRWQLLGGKTRVRFQACLHDQGQLHLLLRSACCEEGHWHQERRTSRSSRPSSRTMLACFLATIGRSSATSPRSCPRPSLQESSPPTLSMASSSGKTSRITTSTRPCFTKPGNCSRLTAGGRPCLGQ